MGTIIRGESTMGSDFDANNRTMGNTSSAHNSTMQRDIAPHMNVNNAIRTEYDKPFVT